MNVDYFALARERRLLALNADRRQPSLPGMDQPEMAPHLDEATLKPKRARIVYYLDQS
ncbi:hypothetical protein [Roseovarius aestuarii]|uniref:Uncharacterized protein n=1 Tax=Roseovarius aestuarii TaxID=475083 RepID=A0A1X7BXB9_9RHOB|nr:hypothetical protein [Roseovarius aestuarii]SMC14291.1 hypothetical protein ROA7745_04157 [Roseovarius aestuarii]